MCVTKLPVKIDGKIKTFHENEQLKRFMDTKLTLWKIPENILNRDSKAKNPKQNKMKRTHQQKKTGTSQRLLSIAMTSIPQSKDTYWHTGCKHRI